MKGKGIGTGWLYNRNGKTLGPVSSEALSTLARSGILTPDDFVQRQGDPRWVKANAVRGLAFTTKETAPSPDTNAQEVTVSLQSKPSPGGDSAWLYEHEGDTHGPVTWPTLRRLAHQGILLPKDRIRPETDTQWITAAATDGLWPQHHVTRPHQSETNKLNHPVPLPSPRQRIAVLCRSCLATFTVSAEFAGRTGPCPKCKTLIPIPEESDSLAEAMILAGKLKQRDEPTAVPSHSPPANRPATGVRPVLAGTANGVEQESDESRRRWEAVLHLSNYAGDVIPLIGLMAPLFVWQWGRRTHPTLDRSVRCVAAWWIWTITASAAMMLSVAVKERVDLLDAFMIGPLVLSSVVRPAVSAYQSLNGLSCNYGMRGWMVRVWSLACFLIVRSNLDAVRKVTEVPSSVYLSFLAIVVGGFWAAELMAGKE